MTSGWGFRSLVYWLRPTRPRRAGGRPVFLWWDALGTGVDSGGEGWDAVEGRGASVSFDDVLWGWGSSEGSESNENCLAARDSIRPIRLSETYHHLGAAPRGLSVDQLRLLALFPAFLRAPEFLCPDGFWPPHLVSFCGFAQQFWSVYLPHPLIVPSGRASSSPKEMSKNQNRYVVFWYPLCAWQLRKSASASISQRVVWGERRIFKRYK